MATYIVFTRERMRDRDQYERYREKARPAAAGHPLKPLALYGAHEVLEGAAIEGAVILEFPTIAAARAYYHSPALPGRGAASLPRCRLSGVHCRRGCETRSDGTCVGPTVRRQRHPDGVEPRQRRGHAAGVQRDRQPVRRGPARRHRRLPGDRLLRRRHPHRHLGRRNRGRAPAPRLPARDLLNGATIIQEPQRKITYFHLEFSAHEVILAPRGCACESYLDTGNRWFDPQPDVAAPPLWNRHLTLASERT